MSGLAEAWPTGSLDRIAQLRILSAGLPGTWVEETVFDGPFEEVWPRLADLERSVPAFDGDVARLRIRSRRPKPGGGERLRIVTWQTARALWIPGVLDVDVAPGWCWMTSRPQAYVVGMAAEPHEDGRRTRFAHLEGVAVVGPRPLQAVLRWVYALSRWRHRRHIPHDLAGMHRYLSHGQRVTSPGA